MLSDTCPDTIIGWVPTRLGHLESSRTLGVQSTDRLLSCCVWGEFLNDFDFFFFVRLLLLHSTQMTLFTLPLQVSF